MLVYERICSQVGGQISTTTTTTTPTTTCTTTTTLRKYRKIKKNKQIRTNQGKTILKKTAWGLPFGPPPPFYSIILMFRP